MARFFQVLLLIGIITSLGCINFSPSKPLVNLGGSSASTPPPTADPAPGVPRSQLTREQQLQRDLSEAQKLLAVKEKRIVELEKGQKNNREWYQDEIERLEKKNKDLSGQISKLEKENRDLRSKLD